MDVLELIDETFDKDRTEVYELSIQVSLNGFSFAVKDTIRNTYIVLVSKPFLSPFNNHESWSSIVPEIIAENPILTLKFKKVVFNYTQAPFSIIPSDIFEVEKVKDLFELTQPIPEHFELHHSAVVNGQNFVLIFSLPYTLSSAWLKQHAKTLFISPISPLLFNSDISKQRNILQVNFTEQQIGIVYHENEKLVAANSFNYRYTDDAVYFILNFCKTIGTDLSTIKAITIGQNSNSGDIVKTLNRFLPNVSSDTHYNSIHFSYQLLRHRSKYFSLFNVTPICE